MPIYNFGRFQDELFKAIKANVEANNAGLEAIRRLRSLPQDSDDYRRLEKTAFISAGRMPFVREILKDAAAIEAVREQFKREKVPKNGIPNDDQTARALLEGIKILEHKPGKLIGPELEAKLAEIDTAELLGLNAEDVLADAEELKAELARIVAEIAPASSVTASFRQKLNENRAASEKPASPQSVQGLHDAPEDEDSNKYKPG